MTSVFMADGRVLVLAAEPYDVLVARWHVAARGCGVLRVGPFALDARLIERIAQ